MAWHGTVYSFFLIFSVSATFYQFFPVSLPILRIESNLCVFFVFFFSHRFLVDIGKQKRTINRLSMRHRKGEKSGFLQYMIWKEIEI